MKNSCSCHTSLGIQVARLVYKGLVSEARELAGTRSTWTVTESRAILGAGKSLGTRFGIREGISVAMSVMNW